MLKNLSPLFSYLSSFCVLWVFFLSGTLFAGNTPEFITFAALFVVSIMCLLLLKKDQKIYSLFTEYWTWSVFLIILLCLGFWHNHTYQNLMSKDIFNISDINTLIKQGIVAPNKVFFQLIYWITLFFIFILSLNASYQKKFKHRFVIYFFIFVSLLCIYGLLVYFNGNKAILWVEKKYYLHDLTATFINRNSFAIFASCGFMSGLYLVHKQYLSFMRNRKHSYSLFQVINLIEFYFSARVFYIIGLLIILTAIILTHSRSGIFFTLIATMLYFVYAHSIHRKKSHRRKNSRFILFSVIGFFIASPIVLYSFLERLTYTFKDLFIRFEIYAICIEMIKDKPFIGYGLGNFQYAFQYYRNEYINMAFYWDKAHSTFLEMTVELGIPAMMCILFAYGIIIIRLLKHYMMHRDRLTLLYLIILAILICHSFIDFSLQMPAIAILFHIILAAGYQQATENINHRLKYGA